MRKRTTTGILAVCMGLLGGVFALTGCAPEYEHPKLICIHETLGSDTSARILIDSYSYRNARQKTDTPRVTVIWDGREIFSDHLPYRHPDHYRELIGRPYTAFVLIETEPFEEHTLEVIHNGQSSEQVIQTEEGGYYRYYLDYDGETGQVTLVEDPGGWI